MKTEDSTVKKGIITVVGKDQVGIIAKVCTYLAENDVNILDISQTIVQGYFNMMMIVNHDASTKAFNDLSDELAALGQEIGVDIKIQHEEIFNMMHRL
ncbi:MAG: ACT domain-containing protein [Catenibacterium mitsuokai]|jgi:ACT domain-containing protein|nr:ACT domain-containing protein [Catenibacterium mitsuokai]CUO97586.1 ACT domain-containing protein [Catenibacterium mitsuokai]